MALTAWKGQGGGIIISSTPAVIICETCPCACTFFTEVPAGYVDEDLGGPGLDADFSGTWVFNVFGSGLTYRTAAIDYGGGFQIRGVLVADSVTPRITFQYTTDSWATSFPRGNVEINGTASGVEWDCVTPASFSYVEGGAAGQATWFHAFGPFAAKPVLVLDNS